MGTKFASILVSGALRFVHVVYFCYTAQSGEGASRLAMSRFWGGVGDSDSESSVESSEDEAKPTRPQPARCSGSRDTSASLFETPSVVVTPLV